LVTAPEAAAQFGADAADHRALQLYQEGEAAYTEGRYEAAVRAFTAAHRLSPRPLLLYNLANAYERLGRYAEAVDALAEYLPDAPADERTVVQTRLDNLRARLPGAAPAEPASQEPAAVANPEPVEDAGGSSGLLVPGVALGAGGLALVGAGIAFGLLALDARASIEEGSGCGSAADGRLLCMAGSQSTFADAELYALLADIGMIGGGAVAAVGLVLVILGVADGGESSEQASWAPDVRVGPGAVSLGAVGRF